MNTRLVGTTAVLTLAAMATVLFSLGRNSARCVAALHDTARSRGSTFELGAVEPGFFRSELRDVRLGLGGGVALRATSASLRHGAFGDAAIEIPDALLSIRTDPVASVETIRRFLATPMLDAPTPRVGRFSIDVQQPGLAEVRLDGVSGRVEGDSLKLTAETVSFGSVAIAGVALEFAIRRGLLAVQLGASRTSEPRATARYAPSDGQASEWLIEISYQSFAKLRAALSLGNAAAEDLAHIGGAASWIVPDDPALSPRGSVHLVLDHWYKPPWPEASALTGSSGSLAAQIVPDPNGGLRLEHVEIAAALFALVGSGSIGPGPELSISMAAAGRRRCSELAANLPPSRYRETVRKTRLARSDASLGAGEGSVELRLAFELRAGNPGWTRFKWHLSAGCGLTELSGSAEGPT